MQTITIGRDANNNTLKISTNGKSVNGGKVPQSVSREHCTITIKDDGTATITNINPRNVTLVNGQPVTTENIWGNDVVELGGNRFKLDLTPFKLPNVTRVGHLEKIWNDYKLEQEKQRISMLRTNALRSVTGLFSMAAIAISFIKGDPGQQETIGTLRIILYVLAIITVVWTVVSTFVNAPKKVKAEEERKQKFQDQYVCPNCGLFLGFENRFDMLIRNGQCNKCRTKFIK